MTEEEQFEQLNFLEAPRVDMEPPGPNAQEMLARQERVDSQVFSYPRMVPLVPQEGKGSTVRDVDGNYYIDLSSGVGVMNAGHSNPDVIKAIEDQAGKVTHYLDFPGEARLKYSEKLVRIAPGGLKNNCKVFMCGPTGSDAVEAAVKLSKFHSKKLGVISFEGGWHGVSGTGLATTGRRGVREKFLPVMPEAYIVPYAYCYRCRFGMTYPSCDLQCAKFLEHVIKDPDSMASNPGCVLIEPIQGEGGVIVPPDDYIKEVRRICTEYGMIMVMDEIQTGFGRTGAMFASDHYGVTPDIMTISKTLGGGLPLAAVLIKDEYDTWGPGAHVGTFRGNLLAAASGLAAVEFIEKWDLSRRSKEMGETALERLKGIAKESRYIGDVRGKGLYFGLEFVKDKQTKEPAPEILQETVRRCFKRGVVLWKAGPVNSIGRIMPALVITQSHLDQAIDIFEDVLRSVEEDM
jgi:diaminobutyrate-2-oxoglutarate transaminase